MTVWREEEFGIRPLARADLALVLGWRNADRVRLNMYTTHVISAEEHSAWFERLQQNTKDLAFVFERAGEPLGFLSFTAIDRTHGRAHWGFYLGADDVPRGTGTMLGILAMDHAFGALGLRKVIGEVLDFNMASLRLFRRLGFAEEGHFREDVCRDGQLCGVVRFALFRDQWPTERARVLDSARLSASAPIPASAQGQAS